MRLRQLGTSQSVVFFAPPEVHQSILDFRKKNQCDQLDSSDVIMWLLEQTSKGIEQLQPLYFSQGVEFCRRNQAAVQYPDYLDDSHQRESYLDKLRQLEQQTLDRLYGVKSKTKNVVADEPKSVQSSAITQFLSELEVRRKSFKDTGNAVHASALQEVEQEREVAHEGMIHHVSDKMCRGLMIF